MAVMAVASASAAMACSIVTVNATIRHPVVVEGIAEETTSRAGGATRTIIASKKVRNLSASTNPNSFQLFLPTSTFRL